MRRSCLGLAILLASSGCTAEPDSELRVLLVSPEDSSAISSSVPLRVAGQIDYPDPARVSLEWSGSIQIDLAPTTPDASGATQFIVEALEAGNYFVELRATGPQGEMGTASTIFTVFPDEDGDLSNPDCDDGDPSVHPGAIEVCNERDDDCDGSVDEGFELEDWFLDEDADGFGTSGVSRSSCMVLAPDYSLEPGDCDDSTAEVYPGAAEQCNSRDDDCDGETDEELPTAVWFPDLDGDGAGTGDEATTTCADLSETHSQSAGDCDDTAADLNVDDVDGDGWSTCDGDCNDQEAAVSPAQSEICNTLDDDCNGLTDDGLSFVEWYLDVDQDGWGTSSVSTLSCGDESPAYALSSGDCDDSDPSLNLSDFDVDGIDSCGGDCDDLDVTVNPGAAEVCNGQDDNCNGLSDDGLVFSTWFTDADGDGFGAAGPGVSSCADESPAMSLLATDCDDTDPAMNDADADLDGFSTCDGDCDDTTSSVAPTAQEVCNAVDDDCDGYVDDGLPVSDWYSDSDGDGFGDPATATADCGDLSSTMVLTGGDCDDTDATLNLSDADSDGYTSCGGDCNDTNVAVGPGGLDYCDDGLDNDCDGTIDPPGLCVGGVWGGDYGGMLTNCNGNFSNPLNRQEPIYCGWGCYQGHVGLDFDGVLGDLIHSPVDGTVVETTDSLPGRPTNPATSPQCYADPPQSTNYCCNGPDGFGNTVVVRDRLGRDWTIAHLSSGSLEVVEGQVVAAGQLLGEMGNSGFTCSNGGDGSHVHLGVTENGSWVDPTSCLGTSVGGGVTPLDCWDFDEDTYGLGPDCDSQDCDDAEPDHQSWTSDYTGCLGELTSGQTCADRDGDGATAGADCLAPSADCNDFDSSVVVGCGNTDCSVIGYTPTGAGPLTPSFVSAANRWSPQVGCPAVNGPYGVFVHDVRGVELQDYFQADPSLWLSTTDGWSAIAHEPIAAEANLIQGGFWGTYKCIEVDGLPNGGAVLLGAPLDEEHLCTVTDLVDLDGDGIYLPCNPLLGFTIQNFTDGYMLWDGSTVFVHLDTYTSLAYDEVSGCVNAPVVENPIGVPAFPDLEVTGIASQSGAAYGDTIDVEVWLQNSGLSDPTGAVTCQVLASVDPVIDLSDVVVATFQVDALSLVAAAGPSPTQYVYGATWPLSPGQWYVGAYVDSDGQVAESDETNNAAVSGTLLTLGPNQGPPDFYVSFADGPDSATAGDDIWVGHTIGNSGAGSGPGDINYYVLASVDMDVNMNDTVLAQLVRPASQLDPGEWSTSSDLVSTSGLAAGTWYVGVYVDGTFAAPESDEGNNAAVDPSPLTLAP